MLEDNEILGVIYLKDVIKDGLVERFRELREMGIETVMCTGDNELTAATIVEKKRVWIALWQSVNLKIKSM